LVWLFLYKQVKPIMSRRTELARSLDQEIREQKAKNNNPFKAWFEKAASKITRVTGSSAAFLIAIALILIWALTGPIFKYSDTWQLVINTSTTIVTFLMVFIIQQSQNKDSLAIQLKLNELIACEERASNRLIDVEDLTQEELDILKKFYIRLSELAEKEKDLYSSHSVDEASGQHAYKTELRHRTKKITIENGKDN
jgi:low affinity Fe/Cu permease